MQAVQHLSFTSSTPSTLPTTYHPPTGYEPLLIYFPRSEWSSAVWAPPDLYCDIVTDSLFQWAGKAASVAVRRALDGHLDWAEVGDHGIYLALVDVVLQCRDQLRTGHCNVVAQPGGLSDYQTYSQWHETCQSLIEQVYDTAQRVLPIAAPPTTRAEAQRICTAALLAGFLFPFDAREHPPASAVPLPASYLRQYDPTPDQLALQGVSIVGGSVSLDATEESLLEAATAWDARHPSDVHIAAPASAISPYHGGTQPASASAAPLPAGYHYLHLPARRCPPPIPPPPRRTMRDVDGREWVMR